MKINFAGKGYDISEHLKKTTEKKLSRLDKYFKEDVDTRVLFTQEGAFQKVEITIFLTGGTILRAEEATDEMYTSIDRAVDALESQIRKHKTKLQKRNLSKDTIRFENVQELLAEAETDDRPKIVKTKEFGLKPMDSEEAILQMELIGHNFFVFLDAETDTVQVVYKRKDGNYGLLVPAF